MLQWDGMDVALLILDYGGVFSFEYSTPDYQLAMREVFGAVPTSIQERDIRPWFSKLSRGQTTSRDFVRAVAEVMGCSVLPSTDHFENSIVAHTHPPSRAMVKLVQEVRAEGIMTALLSDMCQFEIDRTVPWGRYRGFDCVLFSAESGFTKRHPEPFKLLLDRFRFQPAQVLFVDDSLDNVGTAHSLGLATLHVSNIKFRTADELSAAIRAQLVRQDEIDTPLAA